MVIKWGILVCMGAGKGNAKRMQSHADGAKEHLLDEVKAVQEELGPQQPDEQSIENGLGSEGDSSKKSYWLNGVRITQEEFDLHRLGSESDDGESSYGIYPLSRVYPSGTKAWNNENGQFHRDDGPAIETVDGHKSWYRNGLLHRVDGPAYEDEDGYKEWRQNGVLHREDGPAIEWPDGREEFRLRGYLNRPCQVMMPSAKWSCAR